MSDTAMPELDLPPHPESHVMRWSEREKTTIHAYARQYAASIEAERDAIKLEAQMWKQEAMTHKATVHEAYQAITGATGEPGNWNGAEPIRQLIAERDAMRQALDLVACLHPCLTVDYDDPLTAATAILDQVQAERMDLAKRIASLSDSLRIALTPTTKEPKP